MEHWSIKKMEQTNKTPEQKLREIIREKINFREDIEDKENHCGLYDGFDMSGYGESNYGNLELITRFKEYMIPLNPTVTFL